MTKKKSSTTAPKKKQIKPWLHKTSGIWCITRNGKRYHLGHTEKQAIERGIQFADLINRGLPIPKIGDEVDEVTDTAPTVKNVLLEFCRSKKQLVEQNKLTKRSLIDYKSTCKRFIEFVGEFVWITDLKPEHFQGYQESIASRRNIVSTGNEVTRVKTIFKWAYEAEHLDRPMKFGPDFKRPKKRDVKNYRRSKCKKLFTRDEIILLLTESDVHLRAMVYLGINGGFGNSDCSTLRLGEVDFDKAEIACIRPKTGEERVVTLWPETVEALRLSLEWRYKPKAKEAEDRFFVTSDGQLWVKDDVTAHASNLITKRTTQTLQRLKIHQPGKSFYWLRSTFRTIADEVGDDVSADILMGHSRDGMSATYIYNYDRTRLRKVTDHVRKWLFRKSSGAV